MLLLLLGIVFVVFCIISKKYILEFLSSWINQFRHPPSIGKKETGITVFIFLLIVIFIFIFYLPLLIQTLLPNTDWDAAIYHLPKAESLLHGMWRNNDPLLAHMSNPGGPNLFYAVFMAFGLETAVIPYNFLINLCIILCIFTFTKRFWGLRAACWGAAILATTPLFLKLGVDPRTDNFLAFYILLMVYALFIWLEKPQRSISLLFVAVGFSLALGVKYTALFFGGIVTLITLFMMLYYWRNGSFLHPVRWFFLCTFIVIIPNSVWYINNFLAFRNPVYPIHSGLCYSTPDGQLRKLKKDLEPHLKRALTIPSVKKHNEVLNSVSIDLPKHIFNFYDIIKYPHRYNRKSNILFQPILLLGFLVPIFFYRNKRVLTLYGIGVIYYVVISYFSSGVLRYALPSIVLLASLSGVFIAHIRNIIWYGLVGVVLLIPFFQFYSGESNFVRGINPHLYLTGQFSRTEWLIFPGYNHVAIFIPMIEEIKKGIKNKKYPADMKLFMIGENKGRLLPCEYLPDPSWGMEQWYALLLNADFDFPKAYSLLKKQKVTHIVFNMSFCYSMSCLESNRVRNLYGIFLFQQFIQKYGIGMFESQGVFLYEI